MAKKRKRGKNDGSKEKGSKRGNIQTKRQNFSSRCNNNKIDASKMKIIKTKRQARCQQFNNNIRKQKHTKRKVK